MRSLLVISHDVIGQRMAGPGIRMWEIARVLASVIPVTLIAPCPIDLEPPPGVSCSHYTWGDAATLAPHLATATVVLANGFVAAAHSELLTYRGRLIIDLYDPVAFENLELFRRQPLTERQRIADRDGALLRDVLTRADHVLCATERQRDLYIGGLLTLGRLSPALIDSDPLLRNLIDVVPFGVSDTPPKASGQPALRGVLDNIGTDHEIILWSGGLWDWMDPQTLVRAMPRVLAAVPHARLVFLAGRHPGLAQEMATPAQTRQLAAELGLLGNGIHFYEEWIPYERRADILLEATVMVSLHREHLETRYAAVRSRVLDHFWVGKPTVLSAGDAAAELIATYNAGDVVPSGDSDAVAAALIRLLTDPQRRAVQSMNAAALGQRLRWSQVVTPIIRMLDRPTLCTKKPYGREQPAMKDALQTILDERNALIKALEERWNIALPSAGDSLQHRLQQQIRQRIVGMVEQNVATLATQQREFNGVLVNLIYRLASAFDEQARRTNEQYLALVHENRINTQNIAAHLASLTQQLAELQPLIQATRQELTLVRQELDTVRQELERARDTLPPLHQHVIDLEQRILDLDEAHSHMLEQMSRILTTYSA